jgi:hypothetical protein
MAGARSVGDVALPRRSLWTTDGGGCGQTLTMAVTWQW